MRVCIYGAGAVGGNLAVRLARAGAEVAVVARGAHLAAIRRDGLILVAPDGRFAARVAASDDPADLGPQDVVVATLKTTALGDLAAGIAPLLGPATPVVFATNGIPWWYALAAPAATALPDLDFLDPGGALRAAIAPARIVGGIVYSPNSIVAPGVVENGPGTNQRVILGAPQGEPPAPIVRLAALLQAGGIGAPIAADIRREIWTKLVINVATGPLAVLAGAGTDAWNADPVLAATIRRVREEASAVARAHGYEVDAGAWVRSPPARPGGGHKPSLLQDFERGRAPEIDSMLVALQAFARVARVATPTIDLLTALLAARAHQLGIYDGAPLPG